MCTFSFATNSRKRSCNPFQANSTTISTMPLPVLHLSHTSTSNNSAPPPYADHQWSSHLPNDQSPRTHAGSDLRISNPQVQLQRYLVEAIAHTIKADFKKLNASLTTKWQVRNRARNSILSQDEKTDLLYLSQTMKSMHTQLLASSSQDRAEVFGSVVKPSKALGIESGHALELIAGYADRPYRGRRKLFHPSSTSRHGNCKYVCDHCASLHARTDVKCGGYNMLDVSYRIIRKRLQYPLNRMNTKSALESLALLIHLVLPDDAT
jgi:hypothetical protein